MKYAIGMLLILFVPLFVWGLFQSDWTGASTRAQVEARAQVAVAQAEARAAVEVAAYNAQAQTAQAQAQAQAQIAQSASMAVVFPLVAMTVVVGLLGALSMALVVVLVVARAPAQQPATRAKFQAIDVQRARLLMDTEREGWNLQAQPTVRAISNDTAGVRYYE